MQGTRRYPGCITAIRRLFLSVRCPILMLLALGAGVAVSSAAVACIAKLPPPSIDELDKFEYVVVGRVLTVERWEENPFIDLTIPHEVRTEVLERFVGQPGDVAEVKSLTGCGLPIPEPGDVGIFFYNAGPPSAVEDEGNPLFLGAGLNTAVYEFEGGAYEKTLQMLRTHVSAGGGSAEGQ